MTTIREAGTLTKSGGRWLIQAISPGKGSSGTYPQETLEAAARNRVFPAGTMLMVDHATDEQEWSRPEGSIRDLAGVLTEDARWDDKHGALVAEAKIFEHWRPILESLKDDIGMSIRASAEVEESDGERVIKRIVEGRSIDFVTKAGRGGRVLEVLEAERPTTLTEIAELFQQPAPTTSQPPAGQGNTPNRKDGIMPKIEIEESAHAALVEEASRAKTLEAQLTEAKNRVEELEAAQAKAERRRHVTALVEAKFAGVDAPVTKRLLIESLTGSDKDDDAITSTAKEAAAEHQASTGAGQVRGLGNTTPAGVTEADDELPTWDELAKIKGA